MIRFIAGRLQQFEEDRPGLGQDTAPVLPGVGGLQDLPAVRRDGELRLLQGKLGDGAFPAAPRGSRIAGDEISPSRGCRIHGSIRGKAGGDRQLGDLVSAQAVLAPELRRGESNGDGRRPGIGDVAGEIPGKGVQGFDGRSSRRDSGKGVQSGSGGAPIAAGGGVRFADAEPADGEIVAGAQCGYRHMGRLPAGRYCEGGDRWSRGVGCRDRGGCSKRDVSGAVRRPCVDGFPPGTGEGIVRRFGRGPVARSRSAGLTDAVFGNPDIVAGCKPGYRNGGGGSRPRHGEDADDRGGRVRGFPGQDQYRAPLVRRTAVAKLPRPIAPPGPERAALSHPKAAICPGQQILPIFCGTDADRSGGNSVPPVAELTGKVVPPPPKGTVALDGHGVEASGAHRLPVGCGTDAGRICFTRRGPVAQLAGEVISPGPEGAVVPDGNAVSATGCDLFPIVGVADAGGGILVVRGPVTELAAVVASPSPERAVALDCRVMILPRGSKLPIVAVTNAGGGRPAVRGPVAQSPVVIGSPSPERAVVFDGQGVIKAAGNQLPVGSAADPIGGGFGDGRSYTEFAFIVTPPGPEGAVALDRHTVIGTCRRLYPVGSATYAGGGSFTCRGPDTELAIIVISPGPERTVAFQRQSMILAGRYLRYGHRRRGCNIAGENHKNRT